MGSLKLTTASSGSVILSPANTASDVTITVPAVTGTMAIQGPAFSAYLGTNQTVTQSTWTKLNINTEEFDTNNCFNTSNYRFTPTVAGYYQVNGNAYVTNASQTYNQLAIYKNGSRAKDGIVSSASGSYVFSVSSLIYMNGSTDYIELYGQTTGGVPTFGSDSAVTYFQASMVRAA